ncbi:hypothetical protein [Lysinibacillus sp. FSL K6-3209]|uniref:hypothetical protein n=1 Tax=Lysinibacillus sp. FSL K6-3209 TaxID=2921497 RepID=UPI0030D96E95
MEHTKTLEITESLASMIEDYSIELEEAIENEQPREPEISDGYLLDELLKMQEALYEDEVREGALYESFTLITDKPVILYSTMESITMMGGRKQTLKVMSIVEVKPMPDGQMMIEILAREL